MTEDLLSSVQQVHSYLEDDLIPWKASEKICYYILTATPSEALYFAGSFANLADLSC